MARATDHCGMATSPGLAAGPIALIDAPKGTYQAAGSTHFEKSRLETAIAQASEQLGLLMTDTDEEAEAILEFQVAMLEDDALSEPAFDQIAAGSPADQAWTAVLDEQVADYSTAEDAYFRARSADMTDLRDRVLNALSGRSSRTLLPGSVLAGTDITPSRFLETDWSGGGAIILSEGSPTSHVAMLARARGIPMITGIGDATFEEAELALVDAVTGRVMLDPSEDQKRKFERQLAEHEVELQRTNAYLVGPARTRRGTEIQVMVNIASPDETEAIDISTCDGVGLMRSEFLFYQSGGLADEDTQYRAYTKVLRWAGDRPVTIRTLDAGGDKPIDGLTIQEDNPFLGYRGIRLSLGAPDIFKTQLRALCRAACLGNLKIMLPMVTVPQEISSTAALLDLCLSELAAEGISAAKPPLGIMVEVPAVAICPESFREAAFFSIGSNDLTQYVTAVSRDSGKLSHLNMATNPAVLKLIHQTVEFGASHGVPVSLCGDAGSDTAIQDALLKTGLTCLSVAPAALGRVKAAICECESS